MLDIQRIRSETDAVKRGLATVGVPPAVIDEVVALDEKRRDLQREGDALRAELNSKSKEIGRERDPQKKKDLIDAVAAVKRGIKGNEAVVP